MDKFFRCICLSRPKQPYTTDQPRLCVSAPYNIRIIHQHEDGVPQAPREDTNGDVTKFRHSICPGVQFMSDLHYERYLDKATNQYAHPDIAPSAPYIILAGDIGRFCDLHAMHNSLKQICSKFDKVLFVPGNHEFYGASREQGLRIADALSEELGDTFVFMDRKRTDLENVVILGCTLHSHIPEGARLTNDFAQIEGWAVAEHNAEHSRDLQWLERTLADIAESQPTSRVVIATHYAPAFEEANHPRLHQSEYRYCFSSNTLEQFKTWKGAHQVSHWIFGHTHYNTSFTFGETLFVSNQPNDGDCNRKFDPEATI